MKGSGIDERPKEAGDPQEIDLVDYLWTAWRHRWVILVATVVCAAAGYVVAAVRSAEYPAATAKLEIAPAWTSETGDSWSFATFRNLVATAGLTEQVVRQHDLERRVGYSVATVAARLSIQPVPDTNMVVLSLQLPDPALAARTVNAIAELAVEAAKSYAVREQQTAVPVLEAHVRTAKSRLDAAWREALSTGSTGRPLPLGMLAGAAGSETRVAEQLYLEAVRDLEARRVRDSVRRSAARIIDPAVPPTTQLPRHPVQAAVVAGLAGVTLALLAVFGADMIRRLRRGPRAPRVDRS